MKDLFNGILSSRSLTRWNGTLATGMLIGNERQLSGIDREELVEEERVLSNCRVWCENSSWPHAVGVTFWVTVGDDDETDGDMKERTQI